MTEDEEPFTELEHRVAATWVRTWGLGTDVRYGDLRAARAVLEMLEVRS